MQKVLNLLGLATRARKTTAGEEPVTKGIRSMDIVFLASDAGPNTEKKIVSKCGTNQIRLVRLFNREEISKAIGKNNRVVCGLKDKGFAKAMIKLLDEVT